MIRKEKIFVLLVFMLEICGCRENSQDEIEKQLKSPLPCISKADLLDTQKRSSLFYSVEDLKWQDGILWIKPENLRSFVLEGNRSLLRSALEVHKAKEAVNISRAELFPSIGLSAIVTSSIQPHFMISAVEYLLPFLIPTKWMDYRESKDLLHAEKIAFLVAELNQVSSAYALSLTLNREFYIKEFLSEDLQDTLFTEQLVAESVEMGESNPSDLDWVRSQVMDGKVKLLKWQKQMEGEMAEWRQAMALCSDISLGLEVEEPLPSLLEDFSMEEALEMAVLKAPEMLQIKALQRAAREGVWKKIFGFMGSVSATQTLHSAVPGSSYTFSFSNLMGRGALNFGLSYFPKIRLSQKNIQELELRRQELILEMRRLLEVNLQGVWRLEEQLEVIDSSIKLMQRAFEVEQKRFQLGEISLQDLLQIQGKLRVVRLERMQVENDLDLARVTLHRLMRTGIFESVQGCATGLADGVDPFASPCNPEFLVRKLMGSEG